ncbi:MAG TPA: trypsin-like peptidase domain-containing protein [Chloroflexia bacterium]|jgi:hypothetical protein
MAEQSILERWKRAVVHLEGVSRDADPNNVDEQLRQLDEKLRSGAISQEEYDELTSSLPAHGARSLGTAIFFAHMGRRYLITARHVLADNYAAAKRLQEETERNKRSMESPDPLPSSHYLDRLQSATESAENLIYNLIVRVPSLNEALDSMNKGQDLVTMSGIMSLNTMAYTLTDKSLDIGILSVDTGFNNNKQFMDELEARGYEPITVGDIADGPSAEGAEVFSVGYPGGLTTVARLNLPIAVANWASKTVSVPAFVFGRVSVLHSALPYFWCDMSNYPGNSGAPVVENGKLIGIAVTQPASLDEVLHSDTYEKLPARSKTGMPFAQVVKANNVKKLIDTQLKKDEWYLAFKRPRPVPSSEHSTEQPKE